MDNPAPWNQRCPLGCLTNQDSPYFNNALAYWSHLRAHVRRHEIEYEPEWDRSRPWKRNKSYRLWAMDFAAREAVAFRDREDAERLRP